METAPTESANAVHTYTLGQATVHLYGAPFNWSLAPLQAPGDAINAPELVKRLSQVLQDAGVTRAWAPNPSKFNATVVDADFDVFTERIVLNTRSKICRGVDADGVVIPNGESGMIASADCPTIVAINSHVGVIMAHAGRDSLIDRQSLTSFGVMPSREHFSVVDAIAARIPENVRGETQVFITCGIGASHFAHPAGGTNEKGEEFVNLRNVELREYLTDLGKDCLHGDMSQVMISLPHVIAEQFRLHGITDVSWDDVDTYADREADGRYRWHSTRRGRNAGEKQYRNLVLVTHH